MFEIWKRELLESPKSSRHRLYDGGIAGSVLTEGCGGCRELVPRFPFGNEGCVIPPAEVLFRRALCSSPFQGLPQLKSNTSSKVTPPPLGSLPPITDEQRVCQPSLLVETTSDTSWEDHPIFRTPPKAGWGFCWDYITAQFPPLFNPASFPSPISTDPKGSP